MQDVLPAVTTGYFLPSPEWVRDYFHGVDTMRPKEVTRHFAADGRFRFGNAEAAVGRPAIAAMLEKFYAQLSAMRHEETGLWTGDNSAVFEAVAHFTRKSDGKEVPLPAVSILRFGHEGLITDFRMVMDAAPLNG